MQQVSFRPLLQEPAWQWEKSWYSLWVVFTFSFRSELGAQVLCCCRCLCRFITHISECAEHQRWCSGIVKITASLKRKQTLSLMEKFITLISPHPWIVTHLPNVISLPSKAQQLWKLLLHHGGRDVLCCSTGSSRNLGIWVWNSLFLFVSNGRETVKMYQKPAEEGQHACLIFFSAASLQLCSVPTQPLSRSVANSRKRSFVNWHGAGSRGLSFSPWLFNCWRNACVLQTKSSDLSRTRKKQTCSGAGGQPTGHIEITAWQPSRKEKQTPDQWKPLLRHTCPRLPV